MYVCVHMCEYVRWPGWGSVSLERQHPRGPSGCVWCCAVFAGGSVVAAPEYEQGTAQIRRHDSLAERSKAVAQGAIPKGRGLEPHSCHLWWPELPAAAARRAASACPISAGHARAAAWADFRRDRPAERSRWRPEVTLCQGVGWHPAAVGGGGLRCPPWWHAAQRQRAPSPAGRRAEAPACQRPSVLACWRAWWLARSPPSVPAL